jgi:hypothetical protein
MLLLRTAGPGRKAREVPCDRVSGICETLGRTHHNPAPARGKVADRHGPLVREAFEPERQAKLDACLHESARTLDSAAFQSSSPVGDTEGDEMKTIQQARADGRLGNFAVKLVTIVAKLGSDGRAIQVDDLTLLVKAAKRVPGALCDLERYGYVRVENGSVRLAVDA